MKLLSTNLLVLLLVTMAPALFAQRGGGAPGGAGGGFDPGMRKLLGDNKDFICDLEFNVATGTPEEMMMGGKMSYSGGKSRFELDMANAKGAGMNAAVAQQLKAMGMSEMTTISLPDAKTLYIVYPKLKSYAQQPIPDAATRSEDKFKVETTELGKETVNGHPCAKMKYVLTDDKGEKREGTVWNATDLKNFPMRIKSNENGKEVTVDFKNVKLDKPATSQFAPPTEFTSYPSVQAMMQDVMTKQLGGAGGFPPPQK